MTKSKAMITSISKALLQAILLCSILFITSCQQQEPVIFHHKVLTFGSIVDIQLTGITHEQATELFAASESQLHQMHVDWHAWHSGQLSEINQALAQKTPYIISDEMLPLVKSAKTLYEKTRGYYNPAIGHLVELWKFHAFNEHQPQQPPSHTAIEAIVAYKPSMDDIILENNVISSKNSMIKLDLGGFAKGYAVDVLIDTLRTRGVQNALVSAGGDLRAIGCAGTRPWHVGIADPNGGAPIGSIYLQGDETLFTSGDYARGFDYKGRRYHHIIDPKTGYPTIGIRSVTVIHNNGAESDAAATALMVAGLTHWKEVSQGLGIEDILLIGEDNVLYMTPKMKNRIMLQREFTEIVLE